MLNQQPSKSLNEGKLIAFMGLPASGKSSIVSELSAILSLEAFLEPEETSWPDAVLKRELSGYFTAITWFRSIRVPQLFMANKLRDEGKTVLIDSYYDKLIYHYLGKPRMEWLISPTDKYYEAIKLLSELDYEYLPNADCIVFLRLNFDDWMQLIHKRNRQLDNDELFRESFVTQDYFLDAINAYSNLTGAKIIVHEQTISSPYIQAQNIASTLLAEKIIKDQGQS